MNNTKNNIIIAFCLAILVCLFLTNVSYSMDWPTLVKNAKARHQEFLKDVKDMELMQEMTVYGEGGANKSEVKMYKKGEKSRIEANMQMGQASEMPPGMANMQIIVIDDGVDTWMISSFAGKTKVSPEEKIEQRNDWDWWRLVTGKATITGSERVEKRDCFVVKTTPSEEFPFNKLWVDKSTYFMVKGEAKDDGGKETMIIFKDFRKVKGKWEMPYYNEAYHDGNLFMTFKITSAKINKGLSDALFDPDKVKVKGSNMMDMMKKMMEQSQE